MIKKIHDDYKTKKYSPHELIKSYLDRIKKIDPKIRSYLTLNEENALKEARNIKAFDSSLLAGIPISVKDNYCTKDLRTTASSRVLDNFIPPYNATVIKKIKESKAIILGKTNMDAWAHGSSTETSDYGATLNPWDTKRLPGGSSGGSAATISADIAAASLGSETAGSIRQPASWCGVTGLKPTYGRVSRYGIIAMGSSLDSPGPIAKTVEDCAIILNHIAGCDSFDATSSPKDTEDYTKNLNNSINGLKIGISEDYFGEGVDPKVAQAVMKAISVIENLGAKKIKIKLFPPKYAISVYTIIQRSEVSSNLARYDGIRFGNDRSFFGEEAKRRIMLGTYTLSRGYFDKYYLKALKVRALICQDFENAFKDIDIIIGPTSPSIALKVGATKDSSMFGEIADMLVEPSSIAGLAGINIPCGFVENLPVGLQIIGPQFSESLILNIGHQFQKITDYHLKSPKI